MFYFSCTDTSVEGALAQRRKSSSSFFKKWGNTNVSAFLVSIDPTLPKTKDEGNRGIGRVGIVSEVSTAVFTFMNGFSSFLPSDDDGDQLMTAWKETCGLIIFSNDPTIPIASYPTRCLTFWLLLVAGEGLRPGDCFLCGFCGSSFPFIANLTSASVDNSATRRDRIRTWSGSCCCLTSAAALLSPLVQLK